MEELQKFQSSAFDTIARRKLIEDQNTILELSGHARFEGFSRCWINSQWKFPRYQSTGVFPTSSNTRRIVGTFLRIAVPQRRAAMHLGHTWYIGKRFLQIHMHLHQLLILKNWINGVQQLRNRFTCLQRRKVKDQNNIRIRDASPDRQPKIQPSLVREILQWIMGQTNNDCKFRIFFFD